LPRSHSLTVVCVTPTRAASLASSRERGSGSISRWTRPVLRQRRRGLPGGDTAAR
jgi:hypothetical protein